MMCARSFLSVVVAVLCAACSSSEPSSSPSSPSAPDAGGDAPTIDQGVVDSGADVAPDEPNVPSIKDGLLMAVQGNPAPAPGEPTPFILVGCPVGGAAEVHVYVMSDDGSMADGGRYVATFSKTGIQNHLAVGSALTVDVDEKDSFSDAPFVYRAIVAADPSVLDASKHQFVARMLNPRSPKFDDVGLLFPEKLVRCQ